MPSVSGKKKRSSWQMRVMWTNRILIDFVSIVASDQSRVGVSLWRLWSHGCEREIQLWEKYTEKILKCLNCIEEEKKKKNKGGERVVFLSPFFLLLSLPPLFLSHTHTQSKRILLHRCGIGRNSTWSSLCCLKLHYNIKPKLKGPAHTLHNALQSFTIQQQHTHTLWSPWIPPWMAGVY